MAPPSLKQVPSPGWWGALALAILVAHEVHELVHTALGRLQCGAWGARDFNVWSLAPGCSEWAPTLAGPLLSWIIMWWGVTLLAESDEHRRWFGLALVFAPNPLGRLLPALLGGGDEGVVARRLLADTGLPPRVAVVTAAMLLVLPPLMIAWRAFAPPRRVLWFVALLFSGIVVTGPLLLVAGNQLLAHGVLAQPGPLGAPMLIELVTVTTTLLLLWRWRALGTPTARRTGALMTRGTSPHV